MPVKSITVMNMMVFQNQWRFNNGMPQEYSLKRKVILMRNSSYLLLMG